MRRKQEMTKFALAFLIPGAIAGGCIGYIGSIAPGNSTSPGIIITIGVLLGAVLGVALGALLADLRNPN
jgi:hypothetical protein